MPSLPVLRRLVVVFFVLHLGARAETASSASSVDAEWEELARFGDVPARAGPAGVPQMPAVQQREWVEQQDRAIIKTVLAFVERHPTDPRRWSAVLLAAGRYPKFASGFVPHAEGRDPIPVGIDEAAAGVWATRRSELLRALVDSTDASDLDRARAGTHLLRAEIKGLKNVSASERAARLSELTRTFDQHVARFGQLWDGPRPLIANHVKTYLHDLRGEFFTESAVAEAAMRHLAQNANPVVVAMAERALLATERQAVMRRPEGTRSEALRANAGSFVTWMIRHQKLTMKDGETPLTIGDYDMFAQVHQRTSPDLIEEFLSAVVAANLPRISDLAAERLEKWRQRQQVAAKPVELAFTAVDGRSVDLQALRGKVVLIDFWATWCGPCIAELPSIKKVYAAYHDRGFEIIGIALEHAQLAASDTPAQTVAKLEKAKKVLTDFTAKNAMPWPQYFDGHRMKNPLTQRFGITSIPAMFLLDQQGNLVTTEARGEKLEAEVKRLLGL